MKNNRTILVLIIVLTLGAMIYFWPKSKADPERDSLTGTTETSESKSVAVPESEKLEAPTEVPPVKLSVEMNDLPQLKDLQGLTEEEVHHTPEFMIEGGKLIGRLIEEANQDPARREETLKFLKSCAENDEVVAAIRAVCWKKTLNQISEWKTFLPISDAKVPPAIRELATKIP